MNSNKFAEVILSKARIRKLSLVFIFGLFLLSSCKTTKSCAAYGYNDKKSNEYTAGLAKHQSKI